MLLEMTLFHHFCFSGNLKPTYVAALMPVRANSEPHRKNPHYTRRSIAKSRDRGLWERNPSREADYSQILDTERSRVSGYERAATDITDIRWNVGDQLAWLWNQGHRNCPGGA